MPDSNATGRGPGRPPKAEVTVTDQAVVTNTETPAPTQNDDMAELLAELRALRSKVDELEEYRATEEEAAEALRPKPYKKAAPGEKFLLHFVNDGLSILGKIWFTGQELEVDPTSQAYKDTEDVTGFSILELRNDAAKQERLLGKEYFREGPWTGRSYADVEFERLKALAADEDVKLPTKEELRSLDVKERSRKRQAEPLTPMRGAPRPKGY